MSDQYPDINIRQLRADERPCVSSEASLPLVIEADKNGSVAFLKSFLTNHSEDIVDKISQCGAILFRGFDLSTTKEFEDIILSIRGMKGMSHLFMSEPGRVLVDNLNFVFHTNSKYKTGGTFHLGGFHNENYYSTDVPAYIAFCCFSPAKMGGETGMINMRRVYERLDSSIRTMLETKAFFVAKWPVSIIAERYKIKPEVVSKACASHGLTVEKNGFISMHKPSVFKHPATGKNVIQANLCSEVPGLNDAILKLFKSNYSGWKWSLHKAAWTYLGYQRLKSLSVILPELAKHPIRFMKMRQKIRQRMSQYKTDVQPRIGSAFKQDHVDQLAKLMHESYSSFHWQKGDVLIIDNLQVAHAGMPGKTNHRFPRKIRAMLCNPLKIDYADTSPGVQLINDVLPKTLGETMVDIARGSDQTA